ncbi:response regulator receiver domain-containing protein [Flavobacterium chryseum]|uniref:response regulator n=1 Tax=Flavobacterium sp. P3160 TaxID=2512113 RepID=UPI00105E1707|nr:response regulator [Flavobacterium sp. P3160]TDO71154.1 response regulator receiver domain-containing protein [Flavobacterium sp. P3160]
MDTLKILLIDDDEDDREFFKIALDATQIPMTCLTAERGTIAIDLLNGADQSPDFIFLDLNMPLMSGKECLFYLRSVPAHSEIPVVIFTTSSYSEDIEECKKLGATNFLTKTPDLDHLSTMILKILTGNAESFNLI